MPTPKQELLTALQQENGLANQQLFDIEALRTTPFPSILAQVALHLSDLSATREDKRIIHLIKDKAHAGQPLSPAEQVILTLIVRDPGF
jgi:hypothetical protein